MYLFTDYIGCLRSPGERKNKGGANEDNTIYRKLEIKNLKYVNLYKTHMFEKRIMCNLFHVI
jgi:hypothetical protein